MESKKTIDDMNLRGYSREKVLARYNNAKGLRPAEEVLFSKLKESIEGKKILDIGIGGGRTTDYLFPLAGKYVGIDYAKPFADMVATKYPEAEIYHCDARDMSILEDSNFNFVLFSHNGIDTLNLEGRMKALMEVWRVLKSGGTFMFSSHNKGYKNIRKMPWQAGTPWSVKHARRCVMALLYYPRHLKMLKYEADNPGYSIINDTGHRFSLMTYYSDPNFQRKQLVELGFHNVTSHNETGVEVESDTNDLALFYLATK